VKGKDIEGVNIERVKELSSFVRKLFSSSRGREQEGRNFCGRRGGPERGKGTLDLFVWWERGPPCFQLFRDRGTLFLTRHQGVCSSDKVRRGGRKKTIFEGPPLKSKARRTFLIRTAFPGRFRGRMLRLSGSRQESVPRAQRPLSGERGRLFGLGEGVFDQGKGKKDP